MGNNKFKVRPFVEGTGDCGYRGCGHIHSFTHIPTRHPQSSMESAPGRQTAGARPHMIMAMMAMMIKMNAPEDGFWTTGKENEMLEHICTTRGSKDAP